jgi:integrase
MNIMELTREYLVLHDLRPSTWKIYISSANRFTLKFGDQPLSNVCQRDVLLWRKELLEDGLSKRSWNTYSSHLRTIFKYAIEEDFVSIPKNPFNKTSVMPPKRKKKTVAAEAIELARSRLYLLKDEEHSTGNRSSITPAWFWLIVFETFYYTGIRLNALLNVTLGDVNLKHRLIHVRAEVEKTHREFLIPIPDGLLPHLHTIVQKAKSLCFSKADQLFNVNRFSSHYRGTVMNVDQVEAMYKKLIATTGVRMTPHRFRHTIASDLMKQPDRNIHVTKTLLNHSNMATTMEYIEPDYEVMRMVMNERSLPKGFEYYMERSRTSEPKLGPSVAIRHVKRHKLHIDRTPPPALPPREISAVSTISHDAKDFGLNDVTRDLSTTLSTPTMRPESKADEPLSQDEMTFIGKFLDWLRYRGVDDGAQLLLDRKSSISEQLQASKGSFEGIAWVNRPGR